MTKKEFVTERTRIISEMLDNPDEYDMINPTIKCFQELDDLYDRIISGQPDTEKEQTKDIVCGERDMTFEEMCNHYRGRIQEIGSSVKYLMDHSIFKGDQMFDSQHSEMKANIMLSYRHLEDARMRLGKVMQQIQGGVSKYDK